MPERPSIRSERQHLAVRLVDQLAYLIDEVEAQRPLLRRLPAWVLEGRPFAGTWSIKEMYGALAAADERVHLPVLRRLVAGEEPSCAEADLTALQACEPWNTLPLEALLDRVQAARRALVAFLRALPPEAWERTARFGATQRDLYACVHAIILQDTDCLREVGYRLHESGVYQGQASAAPHEA
ncbi:MAG: DinB family protein [Bacteroidetes bacterium]|nr:MAG: DinB family protein [Bacteroidota bacterium]